ncbi:hypothetical protein FB446DRAFT_791407 [Lentinula raphanica]|nr:hypothetical protein FB446DRAFT_791407 [Lentinula raphanica]
MGDSSSLPKRKNPPDPGKDNETTPKGPRAKSILAHPARTTSPTPAQRYKNPTAERAASRKDGRYDPIKATTQTNTTSTRRNENSSTSSIHEREGRESQLSNYSDPGPMDQDQDWIQPGQEPIHSHSPQAPQQHQELTDQAILTSAIFFTIEQLTKDLRRAIREGAIPSNFDEQVGSMGEELVDLLSQVGIQGNKSNDKVTRAISKLTESFAEARRMDSARITEIERALRIKPPSDSRPNWAADSYASKAAHAPLQTNRTTTQTKKTAAPSKKENERLSQFVVHFAETVPEEMRKDPCSITRDLNNFIGSHPNVGNVRVATAKWNLSGNLVLSTMAGQSAEPLEPLFREFQEFYTMNSTAPTDTKLNQVWHKIIVDGVSTGSQWRLNSGIAPRPHNPAELKEEITMYNPVLAEVKFALEPRFVVQASELANKRESSIQFAVSDSQLAEAILRVPDGPKEENQGKEEHDEHPDHAGALSVKVQCARSNTRIRKS